jgi:hypothetical protein
VSGKKAGLSKPVLGEKKGANVSRTPSLPGKSTGLWAGKDPYGPSSPESQQVTCAKNKTIYDLPSVDAHAAKPAPMRAVARKLAGVASSSSFAGNRVNRPNKKIAIAVFQDPLLALSSSSHHQAEEKGTPASLSRTSRNTLARRMTESPLAEVTQAYTGSGRFQASPVPILSRRLLSRGGAASENNSMDSVLSLDSPNVSGISGPYIPLRGNADEDQSRDRPTLALVLLARAVQPLLTMTKSRPLLFRLVHYLIKTCRIYN